MERNSAARGLLREDGGFTLLEVLIAIAIMVTALASIYMIEGSSLAESERAKRMNVVAVLANNEMIRTELALEGKTFDAVSKDKTGKFKAPYAGYEWKRTIKKIKFPVLAPPTNANDPNSQVTGMVTKLVSNYLSKALREVTVKVIWHDRGHIQSFSVSTYWVDLNHEFELSP